MKLKSLEISGFKSFADDTKIDFETGVTGIVGPNGSGKSNISEAVRWVLGEQSAKNLRGQRMPDVIFAGSAERKPLNRAMVTMVLDNTDHYLKSDYTEVSVTRKLFRNGDSVYQLNGQECRLKDITDLFLDSGIGDDSFSMISQGRVEAIFNSKPEDRRFIIEEVTGVSKYKLGKQKAQREMEQTAEYLDRVNDLITELSAQVEPLAEQSSLAEEYVTQKAQFDTLEQSRLVLMIDNASATLKTQTENLTKAQAELKESRTAAYENQKQVTAFHQQETKWQSQKDKANDSLIKLSGDQQKLAGQRALNKERRANRAENVTKLKAELATVADQLTATQEDLAADKTAQQTIDQQVKAGRQSAKTLKQQLAKLDQATLSQKLDQLQDDYVKAMQALTSLHNERQYLEKNQQRADSQTTQAKAQLTALQKQVTTQEAELTTLTEQLNGCDKTLAEAKQAQQDATTVRQHRQTKIDQLNDQWLKALEVSQQAKARLKSLEEAQANYNGFYQGTKAVMQAKDKLNGVIGPVAELLQVDGQYTKAVEAAIGAQQQNVVVADETAGKQAIRYLTQNQLGRSTFLPLTTIKSRQVDSRTLADCQQVTGFLGVASALVHVTDRQYQPVLEFLLGNVLFADDLDHAVVLGRQIHHRYRIITLGGEVVSASGTMTGGRDRRSNNGLLARQQERQQLAESVKTMDAQLAAKQTELQMLKTRQAELDQTALMSAVTEATTAYQSQLSSVNVAKDRLAALQKQVKVQHAQQALQGGEEDYQKALEDNDVQTAATTKQLAALKADITDTKTEQQQASETSQTVSDQYQSCKEDLARLTEKQHHSQETVQAAKDQLEALEAHQADLQQQLADLTADDSTADQSSSRIDAELTKINAAQKTAQGLVDEATRELKTVSAKVDELELTKAALTNTIAAEQSAVHETQLAQQKTSNQVDQLTSDLTENYHVSVAFARDSVVDQPLDDIKEQLKLLKRGLDDLGDVNLGAIEEYKRVKERYDFLTKQRSDLEASKDNLLTTMNEMDKEVVTRFEKTFNDVNVQFGQTFVKMFGGGRARLELTDPNNLLTTGIEIMAEPPGKKLQSMRLLSGGERALTAITLLFAILQVQPVPFCILDEAEAALDPANTGRFASYLSQFQTDTQFIVITHRKETMVQADRLYGITMQESGVSKLVSVDLSQVSASN
ncbi:chromosome segregation protein SMC [Secundilactobacillus paracollinoides]|uniref:chromosome segregation protein SMC n=1 Tax=Secundilactobacillus paracollinoides TaxID=240427 RepID=UPI00081A617F|nr:chromosome segregation protein SMC [Secundilactobacillus paracollinoides]ANZ62117.1 hypothetical protein AYR61_12695 [Secundilactobacillus paracollinoides]